MGKRIRGCLSGFVMNLSSYTLDFSTSHNWPPSCFILFSISPTILILHSSNVYSHSYHIKGQTAQEINDISFIRYDMHACMLAKSLQLYLTLCNPMVPSPPCFSVQGILQARILEWVASSFSNAWKWKVKVKLLSRVRLFATPWTAAYQGPPSMGFSRQEYWNGVPLPSPKIRHIRYQIYLKALIIYLTWYELQRNTAEKVYSRVWLTMFSPKLPLTLSGLHKHGQLLAASCSWPLFAFRQGPQHMFCAHLAFSFLFSASFYDAFLKSLF